MQLSEHHAVVDLAGAPLPRVGSQVDVVPNHCCAAVNLADELWVEEHGAPAALAGRRPGPERLSARPLRSAACRSASSPVLLLVVLAALAGCSDDDGE